MILNREYYFKVSQFRRWWSSCLSGSFSGEKVFKAFKLHKTEWPNKLYFYSQRLKKIPQFTGDKELLSQWKESKLCETICPTSAITVTANAFIVDDRGCIACGLCVEMAPPGILEFSTKESLHRS